MQLGAGDLFAFKISYDDVLINNIYGVQALYNGNIAETQWITSTDNTLRHYGYQYDHLNRLLNANFRKPIIGDEQDAFNETLSYDKNGNIEHLTRNGKIYDDAMAIDDLVYNYQGNQLMPVEDSTTSPQGFNDGNTSGDDYGYDENGNMVFDKNKGIELIKYNHLNLPTQIQFANGNNIDYFYNAVGQKVKKVVKTGAEYADTDYLGGFQYRSSYTEAQGDLSEATLQYFPHAEGYVQLIKDHFFYIYHYTDHLGNIRLSYTYDENTGLIKIMEENHYYPFGLKHDSYNTNRLGYSAYTDEDEIINYVLDEQPKFIGDGSYNYKYNGKELQDELGLNVYAYGWRDYDPALGRFNKMDRFAEKYHRLTPYGYAGNNPVLINDIQGDSLWISFGKNERVLYENGNLLFKGADGKFSQYKGKYARLDKNGNVKGYKAELGDIHKKLNTLESTKTGKYLISSLSDSRFNIDILQKENSASRFSPDIKNDGVYPALNNNAYFFQVLDQGAEMVSFADFDDIGSGGTIVFNANDSATDLGHEMAHAFDAIFGLMDNREVNINGGSEQIREIRAVYYENLINQELGKPLRNNYSGGPSLLDSNKQPIFYQGILPSILLGL